MVKFWIIPLLMGATNLDYAHSVGIVDSMESRAVNVFVEAKSKSKVDGVLKFSQAKTKTLHIHGKIKGLEPFSSHGIHIHDLGNCNDPQAKSAGGHFTGGTNHHGSPTDSRHHAGDLGNFKANKDGEITINQEFSPLKLYPKKHKLSVWGRSIVIHDKADDLKSQPSGNSGKRIGCGVIGTDK